MSPTNHPSTIQLHWAHGKRIKNIEDIKGTSKCARFLQELEDKNATTDGHVAQKNKTLLKPTQEMDMEEALETEDDILERQVLLTTPAEAKKAVIQIIEAKK